MRQPHGRRQPVLAVDKDGKSIVLVPLANHDQPAKLFLSDFERLMEERCSDQWTLNTASPGHAYVRGCKRGIGTGRLWTIARLVLNAPYRNSVRYADGDRLNLRRDNLYLAARRGRAVTKNPASSGGRPSLRICDNIPLPA